MLLPTSWSLGCHGDVQVAVMQPPAGEGCGDNEVFLGRVVVVVCSYQKVKHPGQGLQSSLDTAGIKLKPKAEGVFCKPPPRIGSIENLHKS